MKSWFVTLLATGFLLMAMPAFSHDHDQARAAREAGEVVPFAAILEAVERDFVGRVLEAELEREQGRWIYEIKLLAPGGQVLKLDYDARSRELLRARGRDVDAARRR